MDAGTSARGRAYSGGGSAAEADSGAGEWAPTGQEGREMREYLPRGGFFMADDFHGNAEYAEFVRLGCKNRGEGGRGADGGDFVQRGRFVGVGGRADAPHYPGRWLRLDADWRERNCLCHHALSAEKFRQWCGCGCKGNRRDGGGSVC